MAIKDLIPWNTRSREMTTPRGNDVHPFLALHREMNRMVDDAFRGFDMAPFGGLRTNESLSWPNIDIDETRPMSALRTNCGPGGKGRQLGNHGMA